MASMQTPAIFEKKASIKTRRLETYQTEARKLKKDVTKTTSIKDQMFECQGLIEDHDAMQLKMEAVVQEMNSVFDDWQSCIDALADAEAKVAAKVKMTTEQEKAVTVITDAEGTIIELKSRMQALQNRLKLMRDSQKGPEVAVDRGADERTRRETIFNANANRTADADEVEDLSSKVRLPPMELPTFDGDPSHWLHFWQTFEVLVDKQNYPTVIKLRYLMSSLQGSAQRTVQGYQEVAENYEDIKEILKKRFGNNHLLVQTLNEDLRMLRSAGSSTTDVRKVFESIETICRQLENIGESINHQQFMMTIMEKLPSWLVTEVHKRRMAIEEEGLVWTTTELREAIDKSLMLKEEVDRVTRFSAKVRIQPESRSPKQQQGRQNRVSRQYDPDTRPRSGAFNVKANVNGRTGGRNISCYLCEKDHYAEQCPTYTNVKQRAQRLKQLRRCFRCLQEGHIQTNCEKTYQCKKCQGEHNTLLCFNEVYVERKQVVGGGKSNRTKKIPPKKSTFGAVSADVANEEEEVSQEEDKEVNQRLDPRETRWVVSASLTTANTMKDFEKNRTSLLLTRKVTFFNPNNDKFEGDDVVFFDNGCQLSMISEQLANKLQLKPITYVNMELTTMFTHLQVKAPKYELGIITDKGDALALIVYGRDALIGPLETAQVEESNDRSSKWNLEYLYRQPGLLIGADYYYSMEIKQIDKLKDGVTILSTILGPVAGGITPKKLNKFSHSFVGGLTVEFTDEESPKDKELNEQLKSFWELESIGIREDEALYNDADSAQNKFMQSLELRDGRYFMSWPWIENEPDLPTNYNLAFKCTSRTYTKVQEDAWLSGEYANIFKDQEEKKMIEKVKGLPVLEQTPGMPRVHYLYHRHVLRMDKATTKVRIVFNASARQRKDSKSLNDCLYKGPSGLPDLCGLIMRFRLAPYVVTSDVEKAFLQLGLREENRDVTRFLCSVDPSKPFGKDNCQTFRYTRVLFGVISSPFLLSATIKEHLRREQSDLGDEMCRNIYSDNVLVTAETMEEAVNKCNEMVKIMEKASMNLRQAVSNDNEVNRHLNSNVEAKDMKFLGLPWDVGQDELIVRCPQPKATLTVTKRSVLTDIASVFDPEGFGTPILVQAKIFLQDLWTRQYKWDQDLLLTDTMRWKDILRQWEGEIRIPRCIYLFRKMKYELHCFTDASARAYAAALYVRILDPRRIMLLYARSRLTPTKPTMSMPRLELTGSALGARMIKFVRQHLPVEEQRAFLWTDSQCILSWIQADSVSLPVFVRNRVREIRSVTNGYIGYVGTKENPADLATRGTSTKDLAKATLWWHGPSWLVMDQEDWPHKPEGLKPVNRSYVNDDYGEFLDHHELVQKCLENPAKAAVTPEGEITDRIIVELKPFIRLQIALRTVARAVRFILWTKKEMVLAGLLRRWPKATKGTLVAPVEMDFAEILLLRQEQQRFPNATDDRLVIDTDGVIRLHDRLSQAEMPEGMLYPVYLDKRSRLFMLIVLDIHRSNFHCGVQQTLCLYRERFWTPAARTSIKRILRSDCVGCKLRKTAAFKLPLMPPLPKERIRRWHAFDKVGLDYIGYIFIKEQGSISKIWIALFTCTVTRAVHLEVITELSAQKFLLALMRFISRKRRPSLIVSDNATQFKLMAKVINHPWDSAMVEKEFAEVVNSQRIEWKFIPQLSPWMGGFYERMVGLVKRHFKIAVGRRTVGLEEAMTICAQVEAVVNLRPLTYVYEGSDCLVLKPIDLIMPNESASLIPDLDDVMEDNYRPDTLDTKDRLLRYWCKVNQTIERFWDIWKKEYLLMLRERGDYKHRQQFPTDREPRIGELVHLRIDKPRGLWPLAKIIETHIGADGNVRVATIRRSYADNGKMVNVDYTRPIADLIPLEIQDDESLEIESRDIEHSDSHLPNESHQAILPRRSVRQRRPRQVLTYPLLLSLLLFSMMKTGSSRRCETLSGNLTKIRIHECRQTGFVIGNDGKHHCYTTVHCTRGHLRTKFLGKKSCGPPCQCPIWSDGCSFYEGSETEHSRINTFRFGKYLKGDLLESLRPDVCGMNISETCPYPESRQLFQVQLYDDTLHFVKEIHLHHMEYHADDVECLQDEDGKVNGVTGTPEYCKIFPCNENATKFCWMPHAERVYLQTPEGKVLVKAWGHVQAMVYSDKPPEIARSNDTVNIEVFSIICHTKGVMLKTGTNGWLEICVQSYCERLKPSQQRMLVALRPDLRFTQYKVQLNIFKGITRIPVITKECPAVDECDYADCFLCFAKAKCTTKAAIIVLVLMAMILITVPASLCIGSIYGLKFLGKRQWVQQLLGRTGRYFVVQQGIPAIEPRMIKSFGSSHNDFSQESVYVDPVETPLLPTEIPRSRIYDVPPSELSTELYQAIRKRQERKISSVIDMHRKPDKVRSAPASIIKDKEERISSMHRSPRAYSLTTLGIIMMMTQVKGCTDSSLLTVDTTKCYLNEYGVPTCTVDHVMRMRVNVHGSTSCLLLETPEQKVIGHMQITIGPINIRCMKRVLYYTRPYKVYVSSVKRCAGAGSCHNNACGTVTASDHVSELEMANHYPGRTYCMSSCGCWGCGCFYCDDACLFYRVFAMPETPTVYTVYDCEEWALYIPIHVTIRNGHLKEYDLLVSPRIMKIKDNLQIEVLWTQLPLALTERILFASSKQVAIILENDQLSVSCATSQEAEYFNCSMHKNPCQCHDANGMATCDCEPSPVHREVPERLNLPNYWKGVWLEPKEGTIQAITEQIRAELQLTLRNETFVLEADNTSCVVEIASLQGCTECDAGATLKYYCRTNFGNTEAHVTCSSTSFLLTCDTSTDAKTIQLFFEKVLVHEECEVRCPASKQIIELAAELETKSLVHEDDTKTQGGLTPVIDTIPNIFRLLWNSLSLPSLRWWTIGSVTFLVIVILSFGFTIYRNFMRFL